MLLALMLLAYAVSAIQLSNDANKFNIDFEFLGPPIAKNLQLAFKKSAEKWTKIITRDYATSYCFIEGTTQCGITFTKSFCVDDVLIFVKVKPIDGKGGVLAQAGPCYWDELGKPRLGVMYFDVKDAQQLRQTGRWTRVVMHEMGHVLGLGSAAWDMFNLKTPQNAKPPYYYLGKHGNEGNLRVGGPGPYVQLEDSAGVGTDGSHWKESIYGDELMTGFISEKKIKMPLSLLTVKALQDLGYEVDESMAEPYHVTANRQQNAKKTRLQLGNDYIFFPRNMHNGGQRSYAKPGREEEFTLALRKSKE